MAVLELKWNVQSHALAAREIKKELLKYTRGTVDVDVVSDSSAAFMHEKDIAGVIGKGGKTIDLIEKKLGLHLDIRERKKEKARSHRKEGGLKSFVPAFRVMDNPAFITMRLGHVV